jgi:hypothetical protein
MFQEDKIIHFIVCFFITITLGLYMPLWLAATIAVAIGVGYEVYQKRSGTGVFDYKDIIADIAGALLVPAGIALINIVNKMLY